MMYATYQYYIEEYYGTDLTEQEFPKYAKRASAEMNHVTFGRMEALEENQITDSMRDCMCDVAEKIKKLETSVGSEIASENNDGYSISYRDTSDIDRQKHEIWSDIRTYLAPTGLMYRGWKHKNDLCNA